MPTRSLMGGPLLVGAVTLLLAAGLACPQPAAASGWARRQARLASCPQKKTLDRIDKKVCPATKRRPAITLYRACCRNPNGRRVCKPFAPCPSRSPS